MAQATLKKKKMKSKSNHLQRMYDSLEEIMGKYRRLTDQGEVFHKQALALDLARITGYLPTMAKVIEVFARRAMAAKGRLKNQLEGEFFIESHRTLQADYEEALAEYAENGGTKPKAPIKDMVVAHAEIASKENRENHSEAEANLTAAKHYWDAMHACVNTIKILLKVDEEYE